MGFNSISWAVPFEICCLISLSQILISHSADDAIAFAKAFADKIGAAFVKLEEQPPTARIVIRETRLTLDFAGFRARDFGGRSVPTGSDNQHDGIGSFLALDEAGGEFD